MERFDLALQYAQQAWEKSPVDVDAILLMTEVLDRSGRVQDALIILEKMDDVVVSSDTLGMQQARLIWKSRGAKNALPVMQELMQRFPEHAEILNLLAEVQAECGTVNEAVHTANNFPEEFSGTTQHAFASWAASSGNRSTGPGGASLWGSDSDNHLQILMPT